MAQQLLAPLQQHQWWYKRVPQRCKQLGECDGQEAGLLLPKMRQALQAATRAAGAAGAAGAGGGVATPPVAVLDPAIGTFPLDPRLSIEQFGDRVLSRLHQCSTPKGQAQGGLAVVSQEQSHHAVDMRDPGQLASKLCLVTPSTLPKSVAQEHGCYFQKLEASSNSSSSSSKKQTGYLYMKVAPGYHEVAHRLVLWAFDGPPQEPQHERCKQLGECDGQEAGLLLPKMRQALQAATRAAGAAGAAGAGGGVATPPVAVLDPAIGTFPLDPRLSIEQFGDRVLSRLHQCSTPKGQAQGGLAVVSQEQSHHAVDMRDPGQLASKLCLVTPSTLPKSVAQEHGCYFQKLEASSNSSSSSSKKQTGYLYMKVAPGYHEVAHRLVLWAFDGPPQEPQHEVLHMQFQAMPPHEQQRVIGGSAPRAAHAVAAHPAGSVVSRVITDPRQRTPLLDRGYVPDAPAHAQHTCSYCHKRYHAPERCFKLYPHLQAAPPPSLSGPARAHTVSAEGPGLGAWDMSGHWVSQDARVQPLSYPEHGSFCIITANAARAVPFTPMSAAPPAAATHTLPKAAAPAPPAAPATTPTMGSVFATQPGLQELSVQLQHLAQRVTRIEQHLSPSVAPVDTAAHIAAEPPRAAAVRAACHTAVPNQHLTYFSNVTVQSGCAVADSEGQLHLLQGVMLDGGSDSCLISHECAAALNLPLTPCSRRLSTASGAEALATQVATLRVSLSYGTPHAMVHDLEAIVMPPGSPLAYDLLLGANFLSQTKGVCDVYDRQFRGPAVQGQFQAMPPHEQQRVIGGSAPRAAHAVATHPVGSEVSRAITDPRQRTPLLDRGYVPAAPAHAQHTCSYCHKRYHPPERCFKLYPHLQAAPPPSLSGPARAHTVSAEGPGLGAWDMSGHWVSQDARVQPLSYPEHGSFCIITANAARAVPFTPMSAAPPAAATHTLPKAAAPAPPAAPATTPTMGSVFPPLATQPGLQELAMQLQLLAQRVTRIEQHLSPNVTPVVDTAAHIAVEPPRATAVRAACHTAVPNQHLTYFSNVTVQSGCAVADSEGQLHLLRGVMLDGGSDSCLISHECATALNLPLTPCSRRLSTASGAEALATQVATLRVSLSYGTPQAMVHDLEAIVMPPGSSLAYDLLLGANFLSQTKGVCDVYDRQFSYCPRLHSHGDTRTSHSLPVTGPKGCLPLLYSAPMGSSQLLVACTAVSHSQVQPCATSGTTSAMYHTLPLVHVHVETTPAAAGTTTPSAVSRGGDLAAVECALSRVATGDEPIPAGSGVKPVRSPAQPVTRRGGGAAVTSVPSSALDPAARRMSMPTSAPQPSASHLAVGTAAARRSAIPLTTAPPPQVPPMPPLRAFPPPTPQRSSREVAWGSLSPLRVVLSLLFLFWLPSMVSCLPPPVPGMCSPAITCSAITMVLPDGPAVNPSPQQYTQLPNGVLLAQHAALSQQQAHRMAALVAAHPGAFAHSLSDLTGYKGPRGAFRIELSTTDPIITKPRRYSDLELQVTDKKVQELEEAGIIQPVTGPCDYASAPTLPMKKDAQGQWTDTRFCIDFRRLNDATKSDRYGLPLPEEMFARVGSARWFSKLDMRSGFLQIPVHPDDQLKTAFWARNRLYCYTRMPFGLKNASAEYQRVMDAAITSASLSHCCMAFIDDVLVYSDSFEAHCEHVQALLQMLQTIGMFAHPEKTILAADRVEYLGHDVSVHGLTPTQAKCQALRDMPAPTDVSSLRTAMGVFNYYRCYIPDFSIIAAPITSLTRKGVAWCWGCEQQAAYSTLKDRICTPGLVLRRFDPERPLVLHTDWSREGCAGILGQVDTNGDEYMVACCSRSCNVHERNYASYTGEMLAVVWAVKTLRFYLHGRHFTIVTDHQPLSWLMSGQHHSGQVARWAMQLQEYDFTVKHRPGVTHQNADSLSRFPRPTCADSTGACLDPPPALASLMRGAATTSPPNLPTPTLSAALAAITSDDLLLGNQGSVTDAYHHEPNTHSSYPSAAYHTLTHRATSWVRAAQHILIATSPATAQLGVTSGLPDSCAVRMPLAINTTCVASSFFPAVAAEGVVLLELHGGLGAGLEMLLRNGVHILRYIYCDTSPACQHLILHRLSQLSATFPGLLPPAAYASALTSLPQDVQLQPLLRPGYVLVNTTRQHNSQTNRSQFAEVCTSIGTPLCLDAAQLGARTHHMRDWWTNICDPNHLSAVLQHAQPRSAHSLIDIISPVSAVPTAPFRGRGALLPAAGKPHEPTISPEERHAITERCMDAATAGSLYAISAALHRAHLLRDHAHNCLSLCTASHALAVAVGGGAQLMLSSHTSTNQTCSPLPAPYPVLPTPVAAQPAVIIAQLADVADTERDIHDDTATMQLLQHHTLPAGLPHAEQRRAQRRAQAYVWDSHKLLRRMADGSTRIVPAPAERPHLVSTMHNNTGHFGGRRTAALLQHTYWWRGLAADAQAVVARCTACDRVKAAFNAKSPELHSLPIRALFYRWGVDLCGPFIPSRSGHKYIMVCIEHLSKWVEIIPIPNKEAATTASAFAHHVLGRYGACAEVVTDGGTEFQGAFAELLQRALIDHRTTSANHPQSNGLSERCVQTVKACLRKHCTSNRVTDQWDDALPMIALGYRCSTQESTRMTPYELLFARKPVVPPAIAERVEQPINFDDPELAAELVMHRAAAVTDNMVIAMDNQAVAQHRDQLRYAMTRSGSYQPAARSFKPDAPPARFRWIQQLKQAERLLHVTCPSLGSRMGWVMVFSSKAQKRHLLKLPVMGAYLKL
ncbi:hypothetical protein QJQ45_013261 [Haematococcus lacustris]|nr:hypothetical protein QJQ45_013261 [Haematococcus lacustris]